MVKTEASIKLYWEKKKEAMRKKADFKYANLINRRRIVADRKFEVEIERYERKKAAYIRKKEEEYRRKCLNAIRELKNRPKRVYKSEWPKIKPLEFAMKLAQENAKLRDTDENGRWRCISCNRLCEWEGLAGWHRYSRKFTTICLEPENLNAQCHNCNWITWPKWNPVEKMMVNEEYDKNIIEKYGEWAIQKLKDWLVKFTQMRKGTKWRDYDLMKVVPKLVKENEKLWATKSEEFRANHKPYRNWWHIREEYAKRH